MSRAPDDPPAPLQIAGDTDAPACAAGACQLPEASDATDAAD